jgi:hypothetical protein
MSQDPGRSRQPPAIDTAGLVQRKRAEIELLRVEARLRAFGPAGAWQPGAGDDASRRYRQLDDRRAELAAALASARPPRPGPAASPRPPAALLGRPLLGRPLLDRPIAPAVFDPVSGVYGFGSSGVVQPAPFSPGTSVIPGPPSTGEILTVSSDTELGGVMFTGDLHPARTPDTIWLQNWQVLVPFPAPPVRSLFTYSFGVYAVDNLATFAAGQIMSFVSLGETADLTTGEAVPVDIDAGWPIAADLGQPAPGYNGTYGTLDGQVTVQRSFLVSAGQVPGVAVVLGAAAVLDVGAGFGLPFVELGVCGITITSDPPTGLISYSYQPQLLTAP